MNKDEFNEGLLDALDFGDDYNPFGLACTDALALASELEEHNPAVGLAMKRVVNSVKEFNAIARAEALKLQGDLNRDGQN